VGGKRRKRGKERERTGIKSERGKSRGSEATRAQEEAATMGILFIKRLQGKRRRHERFRF
jgi:hypothetical protein